MALYIILSKGIVDGFFFPFTPSSSHLQFTVSSLIRAIGLDIGVRSKLTLFRHRTCDPSSCTSTLRRPTRLHTSTSRTRSTLPAHLPLSPTLLFPHPPSSPAFMHTLCISLMPALSCPAPCSTCPTCPAPPWHALQPCQLSPCPKAASVAQLPTLTYPAPSPYPNPNPQGPAGTNKCGMFGFIC